MSALKCPQCGLVNFADATQCKRCRIVFANSSATGSNLQGFVGDLPTGIWREQSTLVLTNDAQLPQRCVKCNAVTDGRLKRKFSWHPPALYLLLLLPWVIYLVAVFIVRKHATVELGLCADHRLKRRVLIWISLALALLGVGGFVMGITGREALPSVVGFLLLLAAMVFAVFANRVTYASKIDDRFVWLGGVNADYLNQFPYWPGL